MQVVINVDESMFKDVLENELKAFSHEELHGIIHEAIREFLKEDKVLKGLFINEHIKSSWGYNNGETIKEATPLLQEACKNIDINKDIEDIKDEITSIIKGEAKNIVTEIFSKTITDSFLKILQNNYELNDIVHHSVIQIMNQRNNQ